MAKRLAVVFLAVLFFVFYTGCGKKGASEKEGKTFVYQLTSNPSTLDPQIASGEAAATVITALFEGLARQSEDGSAVPGAAESWTNNADYTEFTFTLREGLVWSDGETPVTAADFVFAFRRALDPATGSPTYSPMLCIQNAREVHAGELAPEELGVTAVDERTLAVRLAYPVENFPALTALPVFMPCNEKFFTETAGRYGLERSTLLGNGPFVIDGKYGWDAGKYINVKGSSSYRGEAGAWPSNIKFYIGSQDIDTSNPLQALLDGTVDVIRLPSEQVEAAEQAGCGVIAFEDTTWGLCFNVNSEVGRSASLRRAMLQCLDRAALLQYLPQGASAAGGVVPPSSTLDGEPYRESAGSLSFPEAQDTGALLAQALQELGLEEAPSVKILYPKDAQLDLMVNEILKTWNSTFHTYYNMEALPEDELLSRVASGQFTVALCRIQPETDGPYAALSLFASAGKNPANFEGSDFQALLDSALSSGALSSGAQEQHAGTELYKQAEQLLVDQGVFYPLYFQKHYYGTGERVEGLVIRSYGNGIDFIRAGK